MPGLVAVSSKAGDAGELARCGVSSLVRSPWERVEIVTAAAGDVALGFAGERGGTAVDAATGSLAVVDGELYGPRESPRDEAAAILRAYLADPDRFVPPEGSLAAAIWDGRAGVMVLMTDRYGSRPLYVAESESTLAASELKALVAVGVPARLDPQAWAELLAYEHVLPGRSPLLGVRPVPAAVVVEVHGERIRERHWWHYRVEPSRDGDRQELGEELDRLLSLGVERRLGHQAALCLSGGLDSRCLALVLARRAFAGPAVTYGAPGSADLVVGERVARRLGLPHRSFPLEHGYIARAAREIVWLTEGRLRCFHAHHLALRPLRYGDGVSALLIGLAGDDVLRDAQPPAADSEARFARAVHLARATSVSDELAERVLTPAFARELKDLAASRLAHALAREEGDEEERFRQLLFQNTQPVSSLLADHFAVRDPFSDYALVDFCRRLPRAFRDGGLLERALLRGSPLAWLPSSKEGVPPALNGRSRRFAMRIVAGRRAVRSRLDTVIGAGLRPDMRGIGDYAADLRSSRRQLLDVLLEPRTLERGQLRAEPVRTLIEQTLSGRARHTRALGMLLTLELFQRQFIDGDGRGAGERAAAAQLVEVGV